METKQKKDLPSFHANLVVRQIDIRRGKLIISPNGLSFEREFGGGFIDVPWENIQYVSVQIFFNIYWRGIIVVTDQGTFQFLTSKTKELIREIAKHLKADQIRKRVAKKH